MLAGNAQLCPFCEQSVSSNSARLCRPRRERRVVLGIVRLVTLILGMSNVDGIYLSADYRVTDGTTGKLIDDASNKMIDVQYPPFDGPRALMAFSGLAEVSGVPTGTWMRETLRGESEVIDASMAHLQRRLDRDVGPRRRPLIINALVVHGQRRHLGALSNVKLSGDVKRTFGYYMQELTQGFVFANGSGTAPLVANGQFERIRRQLGKWPRKTLDYMKLLAEINRVVAAEVSTVSPFCQVAFIAGKAPHSGETKVFTDRGESVPFEMAMILYGVDTTVLTRQMPEQLAAVKRGEDVAFTPDPDESNEAVRRRP